MKKYKWLYAVPALIGVYLIYLQLKKGKVKKVRIDDIVVPEDVPVNVKQVYPLKRGSSGDEVRLLQSILNIALPMPNPIIISDRKTIDKLVVDGSFGPKTEEALSLLTEKKQINSASEFQQVIDIVKSKTINPAEQEVELIETGSGTFKSIFD